MDNNKPLHWENLEDDFKNGHSIVLFLGAGVNFGGKGVDMSWNALLNHLLKYAVGQITHDKGKDIAKMLLSSAGEFIEGDYYRGESVSKIAIEALKKQISTDSNFPRDVKSTIVKQTLGNKVYVKLIQNFLYERVSRDRLDNAATAYIKSLTGGGCEIDDKDIEFFTLFSVVDLIMRNNNIRAVVTQNYDQFLCDAMTIVKDNKDYQRYVEQKAKRWAGKVRDVAPNIICEWKGQTKFVYDGINIYHVHGYIPRYDEIQAPTDNRIVLSMDEFYEDSRNVYSWQIASQLHFLSQYTCIFCGLSLDDYTNQRLLHYVKGKHHGKLYYLTARVGDNSVQDRIKNEFHEKNGLTVLYDENGYNHLYKLLKGLQYECKR